MFFDPNTAICICSNNEEFQSEALYLAKNLEQINHGKVYLRRKCRLGELKINIQKGLFETNTYFNIFVENNGLTFEAKSKEGISRAINYFLIHVLEFIPYSSRQSLLNFEQKNIPADFTYASEIPAFIYREPYFLENYQADFRSIHQTNLLDDSWGLWGHNIGKKIKTSPRMFSQIDGIKNEEQFCFSSIDLQVALSQYIKRSLIDFPDATKFMIAPNDNIFSCTCDDCKKIGNTEKNASPAVFQLINRLAQQFPKAQFFGLAYHSTKEAPEFDLKPNVSIMLSTIHWPKGVMLKESGRANQIKTQIENWGSKTKQIFLWEYAIHFDNYLSIYPTILITQTNLQWLQKLGITGIFLQGTEESYAGFSDLKYFVFAELLLNPEFDVFKLIQIYCKNFFPLSKDIVFDFYTKAEYRASVNRLPLDIYGGINQDLRKYFLFGDQKEAIEMLNKTYADCSFDERKNLNPLLAALYFGKLEAMRVQGIKNNGIYSFNSDLNAWKINDELKSDLKRFEEMAKLSDIKFLGESKRTVTDYLNSWFERLKLDTYVSLIAGVAPVFISNPDEDYKNADMLTDGAFGFTDYFNNWLISKSESVHVKIPIVTEYSGFARIEIGFLQSLRHKIFLPKFVKIKRSSDARWLNLPSIQQSKTDGVFRFSWEIQLERDGFIELLFEKQDKYTKFANALDEIRLVPSN